jgi:hypothetical protein
MTMSRQPHSDCHCGAWILELSGHLTLHVVMKVAVAAKGIPTPCCIQAVLAALLYNFTTDYLLPAGLMKKQGTTASF